jgi:hypothetical protein
MRDEYSHLKLVIDLAIAVMVIVAVLELRG